MNKKIFMRFLWRSVVKRLPKTLSCMCVLSLSTVIVFYALSIERYGSRDVEQKLRDMGPNFLVLPTQNTSPHMDEELAVKIQKELEVQGAVRPFAVLYKIGKVAQTSVVISGVKLSGLKSLFPYMRIHSQEDSLSFKKSNIADAAWVGSHAADMLGVRAGKPFKAEFMENGKKIVRSFKTQVVFTTGDAEDDKIFVELNVLQESLGLHGKVSMIAASLPTSVSLFPQDFQKVLENKMNGRARVKLLRAIAKTQVSFVQSVSRFLWLVAWMLLLLSGLGIMATFMSIVYERLQEMALLKTLGASRKHLFVFFFMESALIGAAGGALGLFIGLSSLSFVFRSLFETPVMLLDAGILRALFVSFFCAILITVLGSILPLLKVMKVPPTLVLKGE